MVFVCKIQALVVKIFVLSVPVFSVSLDIDREDQDDLFAQLLSSALFLEKYFAHSDLLGCHDTNTTIINMADFIWRHCLFNDKFIVFTSCYKIIVNHTDSSLCSPTNFMDFPWEVSSDQSGSNHFLILIKSLAPGVEEKPSTGSYIRLIGQSLQNCGS